MNFSPRISYCSFCFFLQNRRTIAPTKNDTPSRDNRGLFHSVLRQLLLKYYLIIYYFQNLKMKFEIIKKDNGQYMQNTSVTNINRLFRLSIRIPILYLTQFKLVVSQCSMISWPKMYAHTYICTQFLVYKSYVAKTNAIECSSPAINPPSMKVKMLSFRELLIKLYGNFGRHGLRCCLTVLHNTERCYLACVLQNNRHTCQKKGQPLRTLDLELLILDKSHPWSNRN